MQEEKPHPIERKQKVEYLIPPAHALPNHQANLLQEALNKLASDGWRFAFIDQGQLIFERDM